MTIPILLLFSDTGGGHRSAAQAVAEALRDEYPGVFDPSLHDPLRGPGASRLARGITSLYGPTVRLAPRAWGGLYRAFDSQPAADLLRQTCLRLADGPVAQVLAARRPAVVVSFHPLVTAAAVRAVPRHDVGAPVVTVVTDLVTAHAAWPCPSVESVVVPSGTVRRRCEAAGIEPRRCVDLGLPVRGAFSAPPLATPQRQELRSRLGVDPRRFLVVLCGGAEGSGPITRSVAAIVNGFDDVDVAAICGRNPRLERQLQSLHSPRLTVKGFVNNLADWYRAADVVITKAGPQTIAEATCCGAALLLTSHLPGQEKGNIDLVVGAGAGIDARSGRRLVEAIAHLKANSSALSSMRQASLALARPQAARDIASLVDGLAASPSTPRPDRITEPTRGAA